MDDLRFHGPRFKSPSAFVMNNAVGQESIERECRCGHYGLPDKHGFCADEDCRSDRLIEALKSGKARKLTDGTIIWVVE